MKKQLIRVKTILVIEDEQPLLEIIDFRLKKVGYGVITAHSVDEVFNAGFEKNNKGLIDIRSIEKTINNLKNLAKIDAIWLDHNLLGKENGLDFITKLRKNGGRWKKIPIFVVSNTEGSETIKSYEKLGVSNYYIKSNHKLDEIVNDLNTFLDKNRPLKLA